MPRPPTAPAAAAHPAPNDQPALRVPPFGAIVPSVSARGFHVMHRFARLAVMPLVLSGLVACADADIAPFGRTTVGMAEDSPTVRRVRGLPEEGTPIVYEPGTVWPAPSAEPPRALLPAEPPRPPVPVRGSPRSEAPLPRPAPTRLSAPVPPPSTPAGMAEPLPVGTVLPGGTVVTGRGAGPLVSTLSPAGTGLARAEGPAVVVTGPDGAVRHVALPPR